MNLVERIVKVKYKDGELIAVTHKPLDEGDKKTTFKTRAEGSAGKRCRPGDAGRSAPMSRTGNSPDSAPSFYADHEPEETLDPMAAAYERGRSDRRAGKSIRAIPGEFRTPQRKAEADEWRSGWSDEDQERKAA
jgi:hypothetical protein